MPRQTDIGEQLEMIERQRDWIAAEVKRAEALPTGQAMRVLNELSLRNGQLGRELNRMIDSNQRGRPNVGWRYVLGLVLMGVVIVLLAGCVAPERPAGLTRTNTDGTRTLLERTNINDWAPFSPDAGCMLPPV